MKWNKYKMSDVVVIIKIWQDLLKTLKLFKFLFYTKYFLSY